MCVCLSVIQRSHGSSWLNRLTYGLRSIGLGVSIHHGKRTFGRRVTGGASTLRRFHVKIRLNPMRALKTENIKMCVFSREKLEICMRAKMQNRGTILNGLNTYSQDIV